MAQKVLIVEDDSSLREIYSARLQTEGFETVLAHDGEMALALAVKEKPDVIICDLMMPKISGFDVLDILQSNPDTNSLKVIVMSALGQEDDKNRAKLFGADRYLVKSQVTLEDLVKITREVIEAPKGAAAQAADTPTPQTPRADSSLAPQAGPPDAATPKFETNKGPDGADKDANQQDDIYEGIYNPNLNV